MQIVERFIYVEVVYMSHGNQKGEFGRRIDYESDVPSKIHHFETTKREIRFVELTPPCLIQPSVLVSCTAHERNISVVCKCTFSSQRTIV